MHSYYVVDGHKYATSSARLVIASPTLTKAVDINFTLVFVIEIIVVYFNCWVLMCLTRG